MVGGVLTDSLMPGSESSLAELPNVPVKPILMCFICKLSFAAAKSFVSHVTSGRRGLRDQGLSSIPQSTASTWPPRRGRCSTERTPQPYFRFNMCIRKAPLKGVGWWWLCQKLISNCFVKASKSKLGQCRWLEQIDDPWYLCWRQWARRSSMSMMRRGITVAVTLPRY